MTLRLRSLLFGLLALAAGLFIAGPVFAECVASNAVGSEFNGYTITDGFGYRGDYGVGNSTFHRGLDLRVSSNPNVGAFFGGTVTAGTMNGYGNTAIVTNGNVRAVYAHAGSLNVTSGQTISAGEVLGNWSTCTGTCTGPHVHFEYQVMGADGTWSKVDPMIAQALIDSGVDPQSPEFAQKAIDMTANGCTDPNALKVKNPTNPGGVPNEGNLMCDSNIRAQALNSIKAGTQMSTDFKTTYATMPRPISEVANTPCVSRELQRITNRFASAPSMYAASSLGQLQSLAGPVSGIMNNMFKSLFTSFTNAANMNPLAKQFNNFASAQLGDLMSALGVSGPFASALCGLMVDMALKYIQCQYPIQLPNLGRLTGSLNNLLGKGCAGQALTSTLYAASNSGAMRSLAQPVTVPTGGLFTGSVSLGSANKR